jgi:hypothetical protein
MEFGKEFMEIHILVNGKTAKQKVMEFTNGKMVKNITYLYMYL